MARPIYIERARDRLRRQAMYRGWLTREEQAQLNAIEKYLYTCDWLARYGAPNRRET